MESKRADVKIRSLLISMLVGLTVSPAPLSAAPAAYPSLIPPTVRGDYSSGQGYADMDDAFYACVAAFTPAKRRFFQFGDRYMAQGRMTAQAQINMVNEIVAVVDGCFRRSSGGTYSPRRIFDALNVSERPPVKPKQPAPQ